ncbi:hypothetical protein HDV57DRAFT_370760 [Trichoderma longibrachiatum]
MTSFLITLFGSLVDIRIFMTHTPTDFAVFALPLLLTGTDEREGSTCASSGMTRTSLQQEPVGHRPVLRHGDDSSSWAQDFLSDGAEREKGQGKREMKREAQSAPLESFGVTISLLPRGHPPLDKHLMDTNQADGSMAIHSVIRCIAASLGKARRSSQEDFFCGAGQRKTSLSRAVRFKAESARPTGVRRSSWTADGNWDPPSMQLVAVQKIGPGSLDWSNGSRPERANAGSVTVWLTESRDAMERSGCGRGRATWATKRFSTRWDRWNSSVK